MISEKLQTRIIEYVASHGYKITSFGEKNSTGYYRPVIEGKNKPISIKILGDRIMCHDFGGALPNKTIFFTADMKTSTTPTSISETDYKEELQRSKLEAVKHITKILDSASKQDAGQHSLFKEKQIKPSKDSDCFFCDKFKVTNKWTAKRALVIPFKDIETNKYIGAQFRLENDLSKKYSVTGSRFTDAYHLLQAGVVLPDLKKKITFLVESFTTALTLAECNRDAQVLCLAGMHGLSQVYEKMNHSTNFVIVVLDKTKNNEENKALEKLERWVDMKTIPYIQPSKVDNSLLDITDFNDMYISKGQQFTKMDVDSQLRQYTPFPPEILYSSDKGYTAVSPTSQQIGLIRSDKLISDFNNKISEPWLSQFTQRYNIIDETSLKARLLKYLKTMCLKNTKISPKGVGIFKENDTYITNWIGGRFIKNGNLRHTLNMRPSGGDIYIRVASKNDLPNIEASSFTKTTLTEYRKIWETYYDIDFSFGISILGFITQAAYSSFSPHRAHMWLLGRTGSGKTFMQRHFISTLAQGYIHRLTDVSAAGLKQLLSPENGTQNSPLVAIDEAADDTPEKARHIAAVLKLAREMATADDGTRSLRGTKDQVVKEYHSIGSILLSSTTHSLVDPQDISRFLMVDLNASLKTENITAIEDLTQSITNIQGGLMKAILDGAEHYERLFPLIYKRLIPELKDMSHKTSAITACVAGVASLFRALTGSDETAIDQAIKYCRVFIDDQILKHNEALSDGNCLIDDILNIKLNTHIGVKFLVDLLSECDEQNNDYHRSYGVYYSNKTGTISVNVSNFKLGRLTSNNKQVIDPFYCSKSNLLEAASTSEKSKVIRKTCSVLNKKQRWVTINV